MQSSNSISSFGEQRCAQLDPVRAQQKNPPNKGKVKLVLIFDDG